MRCIVTAGPTYESLDQVRRLTNFSKGALGSQLADYLAEQGHEVTLLLGEMAVAAPQREIQRIARFTSTEDLRDHLEAFSEEQVDAVFHVAAVSDFRFGKVWQRAGDGDLTPLNAAKLSTRQGTLLAELVPTPKIISELRSVFPQARLVGWKYEVEGNREAAVRKARQQLIECLTDACVANGPAYGPGFGLVSGSTQDTDHFETREALFYALAKLVRAPREPA